MNVRKARPKEKLVAAQYVYRTIGMIQEHNYLCAVCREQKAVIEVWHGILQPCWDCQKKGYKIFKMNWLDKLMGRGEP